MDVQPDEAHRTPPPVLGRLTTETRRATRQLRIRAHGTPGQSQGRPPTNNGLAAHNVRRPAQPASP
jgi:mRNA-degrading endonuclease toxin of MazEF toxin-antitoxin module